MMTPAIHEHNMGHSLMIGGNEAIHDQKEAKLLMRLAE